MTISIPHRRSFERVPVVEAGESVVFRCFDQKNPAWFHGNDDQGTTGFFPAAWFLIEEATGSATARRAYDATELSLEAGEVVDPIEEYGSWWLVRSARGTGWIPAHCLEQESAR